ncbi:MAG: electron transfer flavoprotein subunit beta/FixA family protein [Candidatus Caenarcaniphilales bacterium]|nr:electron transfer flavoprotein subunit beta/FixA family protein [Candidatus Caenarcaniphilales bacterium]
MKIAVIVSQVPDTTTKIEITGDGKSIDESNIEWILNPYAEFAVEKALLLKESNDAIEEVIIVALGLDRTVSAIRSALAMGADQGVLLKSETLDSKPLADKIKELGVDLILGAKKNIDIEAAWLEAGVAAHLDLPMLANVNKLSFEGDKLIAERESSGAKEKFEISLPAVVTCDKGQDEPRYASVMGLMKAKKKPLEEIDATASDAIGLEAVEASLPAERQDVKIFEGAPQEAAKQLLDALKNDAKVL